jgi:hypothetical protein
MVNLVKHYPKVTAVSRVATGEGGVGTSRLALAGTSSSSSSEASLHLQTISLPSGDEISSEAIAVPKPQYPTEGPVPAVQKVFLQCPKRGGTNCSAVVTLADQQVLLIREGKVQWAREECLASLKRTAFMDLPAKRAVGSSGSSRGLEGQQGTRAAAGGGGGGRSTGQKEGGDNAVVKQDSWWADILGVDEGQFKRWVRLQMLSVLVQFKLNTETEKMELFELRQALR